MPRKSNRASRQKGQRQRITPRPQPQQQAATEDVVEEPVTETIVATAARTPAARTPAARTPAPRTPRRPAPVAATTVGTLTHEQMDRENRYVKSDLIRLLVTMAAVIVFMVVANELLRHGLL